MHLSLAAGSRTMNTMFALFLLLAAGLGAALPFFNRPGNKYRPYVLSVRSGDQPPIYQEDINQVAEQKRQYQAAFASLAARTAAQKMAPSSIGQKYNLVLQPTKALYQPQGQYTRNYPGPVFVPARQQYSSQQQYSSLFQPIAYTNNGVQQEMTRSSLASEKPISVLPDGHLEDTEEVKAAKREHFAAVAKAKAAAARNEEKRKYGGSIRKFQS